MHPSFAAGRETAWRLHLPHQPQQRLVAIPVPKPVFERFPGVRTFDDAPKDFTLLCNERCKMLAEAALIRPNRLPDKIPASSEMPICSEERGGY
jgi:hypothetical protein